MEKTKGNLEKGITLITLIITIIVMIILLGVSTDLIVDGKLFSQAETAVNKTNDKVSYQQGRVDELMGELDSVVQSQCEHTYTEWEITIAPTTTATGIRTRICSVCNGTETEIIPKLEETLITFTIDGTEYKAETGMTWEEWIESEYSKGKFEIFSEDPRFVSYTGTEEIVMLDTTSGWTSSQSVTINEEITEYDYSSWMYREGALL